jgi:Cu/Ag efflux protein CusF
MAAWLLLAGSCLAQEGPRKATIKKVDAASDRLTLTVDGKDLSVDVPPDARMMDADGKALVKGLRSPELKKGAPVLFLARKRDDKDILVGLKLAPHGPTFKDKGHNEPKTARPHRGRIKSLDLERMTVTVTTAGKDHAYALTEQTQVLGAQGKNLRERLRGLKEGEEVLFGVATRDGKEVVLGLKVLGAEGTGDRPPVFDTSGLRALPDLGAGEYQGEKGGLYPGGKNDRPAAHEAAGLARARQVRPLDAQGRPSKDGKIGMVSVGMSNTGQASEGFRKALQAEPDRNPALVFVNGSQGGATAAGIQDPDDGRSGAHYWAAVDDRLRAARLTRAQVQVIWIKEADAGPKEGFPGYPLKLQAELTRLVQALPARFPNLRLVYLSSRTYGGYARSPLNPEPVAYESGFAVKWLIEKQIQGDPGLNHDPDKGAVRAPWLSWGPYLWVNGKTKTVADLPSAETDFENDGTHLSPVGVEKVGKKMLQFFKNDTTSRPWFVRPTPAGTRQSSTAIPAQKTAARPLNLFHRLLSSSKVE